MAIGFLDELINVPGEWLRAEGPESDIVISSRIRLARNFSGFFFSNILEGEARRQLIEMVREAIAKTSLLKESEFFYNDKLTAVDNEFLVERHLISREHAREKRERAVCLMKDEIISLMILEEDHMRIQMLQSGFKLKEVWGTMDTLDSQLEKSLPYAFHPEFGYLTACPTNVGTGIRISSMLHLPALVMIKQLSKVLQALQKMNLAARGMYGEGTQATGNFFQISNQITLGLDELDIVDSLEKVIRQIIGHEREARQALLKSRKFRLQDQIGRALGILKNSYIISSNETMTLLSMARLGLDLSLIGGMNTRMLNELFLLIQPSHLQRIAKRTLSAKERDIRRAELVRERLKSVELA
ncbi:MAG: protein arginine kinase [Candidatus Omnitrophica bacterium]|nr:protein arginine kinase [Candidatus Omnitrophota bacterium]